MGKMKIKTSPSRKAFLVFDSLADDIACTGLYLSVLVRVMLFIQ